MKNQHLLVEDNVESVKRRLETTLRNIKFQTNQFNGARIILQYYIH